MGGVALRFQKPLWMLKNVRRNWMAEWGFPLGMISFWVTLLVCSAALTPPLVIPSLFSFCFSLSLSLSLFYAILASLLCIILLELKDPLWIRVFLVLCQFSLWKDELPCKILAWNSEDLLLMKWMIKNQSELCCCFFIKFLLGMMNFSILETRWTFAHKVYDKMPKWILVLALLKSASVIKFPLGMMNFSSLETRWTFAHKVYDKMPKWILVLPLLKIASVIKFPLPGKFMFVNLRNFCLSFEWSKKTPMNLSFFHFIARSCISNQIGMMDFPENSSLEILEILETA